MADDGTARQLQAHRRHLRGEPQLRQPVRAVGRRQRPARHRPGRRRRRPHDAGRPGRHAVPVPEAARRQPRHRRRGQHAQQAAVQPGDGHVPGQQHRHLHEPLPERAVQHRPVHPGRRDDLPAAEPGVQLPERDQNGALQGRRHAGRPARRLHARPGPPVLPGAVPAQRRPAEPLRDRQRLGRDDDGLLRHDPAADLQVPARQGAPNYVIADQFFQAAFGGSFLNHQYLIAAAARVAEPADGPARRRSIPPGIPHAVSALQADGHRGRRQPSPRRAACDDVAGLACGDWAVNTLQPPYQPQGSFGATSRRSTTRTPTDHRRPADRRRRQLGLVRRRLGQRRRQRRRPRLDERHRPGTCTDPQRRPTADGKAYPYCPDSSFQFHHQPFNYFARYAPGSPTGRSPKDERLPLRGAERHSCPQVSFVKPLGNENEHPGYASEPNGSDHLVDLIKAIETGRRPRTR